MDLVSAAIGGTALVLSLANSLIQWRDRRPRVQVTLRANRVSEVEPPFATIGPFFGVRAANAGRVPVRLVQCSLGVAGTRKRLTWAKMYGAGPLPYALEPGDAWWTAASPEAVVEHARTAGLTGTVRLTAHVRDSLLREYHSRPVALDMEDWSGGGGARLDDLGRFLAERRWFIIWDA